MPLSQIYDDRGKNIVQNIKALTSERLHGNMLDLGCGLGQVSVSAAHEAETVVAVDISRNALKVTGLVANKLNIKNIYPVLSDATALPFKNGCFDAIVCSGVLEWVPVNHNPKLSPEKMHHDVLTEIRRILRVTGFFWLGIENRFAYNYFMGNVDHHSGLRFAPLLPRFLANFYSKLATNEPYRTYLYNYWELKKMFQGTGLIIAQFLTAFPNYANPKIIRKIYEHKRIGEAIMLYNSGLPHSTKILVKIISDLRLTKLFAHNFVVLSRKSHMWNQKIKI